MGGIVPLPGIGVTEDVREGGFQVDIQLARPPDRSSRPSPMRPAGSVAIAVRAGRQLGFIRLHSGGDLWLRQRRRRSASARPNSTPTREESR